jgi:hypothetical protein
MILVTGKSISDKLPNGRSQYVRIIPPFLAPKATGRHHGFETPAQSDSKGVSWTPRQMIRQVVTNTKSNNEFGFQIQQRHEMEDVESGGKQSLNDISPCLVTEVGLLDVHCSSKGDFTG